MIRLRRVTYLCLLLASPILSMAQSSPLEQALSRLQKQATEQPFEKAYLHTDKPYYASGDTIWFKGYILAGQQHHLSLISNVLHVDLINANNTIVKSLNLPVTVGFTNGDIALSDTLTEGSYRLRAYTTWMRNNSNDYFFDKTFNIVNARTNKVFTKTTYSYSIEQGKQIVKVIINYQDINQKPYANREIKYEVNLGGQRIASGKSITDLKGELKFAFNNPDPATLNDGTIKTDIALGQSEKVEKNIAIKAGSAEVDIQFFPEGGNLVANLQSKVAFKAVGSDGIGPHINGVILDNNTEVAKFSSAHFGMGTFIFTPKAGITYKAKITLAGEERIFALPKVLDKGYVMEINNSNPQNLYIQVKGSEGTNGVLSLIAQGGGDIYFEARSKPGASGMTAIIPKDKLPTGIVQFTLFTQAGEPLLERLAFIQNNDHLNLSIGTDKSAYSTREKVQVKLNVKDKLGQPVKGNFSAAVINQTITPVNENTETTILSNILLTSDLKGYIEQPNYYFTNTDTKKTQELDVLMLTQGYHRFEWKPLMSISASNEITYQPEKDIAIAGTVKRNGKPLAGARVTISNFQKDAFVLDTLTDQKGRFVFDIGFADSTMFTIKAVPARGSEKLMIQMDSPPLVKSHNKNLVDVAVNLTEGIESYLQNSRKQFDDDPLSLGHTTMLQQIEIKDERSPRQIEIDKAVKYSSNYNGKGVANQVITGEEINRLGGGTIFNRLSGIINGVYVRPDTNGNPGFYSTRTPGLMRKGAPLQPMQILVDGFFGRDINDLNMETISSIEVLRSGNLLSVYGSRASGGVLVVTTKRGDQETGYPEEFPGVLSGYRPKGYYKAKQFYSPKYEVSQAEKQKNDYRSTISWTPYIDTDANGNATIEFFNADNPGTYRVVVEGVDYKGGQLGRQVFTYTVK
jgi:hypothetical protein